MISLVLLYVLVFFICFKAVALLCRAVVHFQAEGHSNGSPPPYPHYDPIWGLDLIFRTWREFHDGRLSEGHRWRHEKLGHTFVARNLGQERIYTIHPDNIRSVTTEKFQYYGKSDWVEEGSKHIGSGILMNEGDRWKQSRNMLKPIFAKRSAMNETELVEKHVQHLLQAIRLSSGGSLDFQVLSVRFSLDLVTDFLFGDATSALLDNQDNHEARHFLSLVKEFEGPSATFIAVGIAAWLELLPSYLRLSRVIGGVKSFFHGKLNAVLASSGANIRPGPSCFVMMDNAGVPIDRIQDELQNIFFASFDTTAALLANLVDVLARRPDVQQKLRQEISSLNGALPSRQDLRHLVYLRFVIWEALRLYSPITTHSRTAAEETVLPRGGGENGEKSISVPAGTTVFWSTYSLNRSPLYYGDDWAEFRPERWETLQKSNTNFFMPFGSGPRSCMGQEIAYTEVAYVVVRLLQEFAAMESADSRPFKEAKLVTFCNGHGTHVSFC